jgi:hypothetical protein
VWADAIDADGGYRDGDALAKITGVLPARSLTGYPAGTRVTLGRERPHPGAQLSAFEERDSWRYTAFATETRVGQLARLDGRHPSMSGSPRSSTTSAKSFALTARNASAPVRAHATECLCSANSVHSTPPIVSSSSTSRRRGTRAG